MKLILTCISDQKIMTLRDLWPNIVIALNLDLPHPFKAWLIWNRDELRCIRYALQTIAHHHMVSTCSSLHFSHLLWAQGLLLSSSWHISSIWMLRHLENIISECLGNVHCGLARYSTMYASLILDWWHFVALRLASEIHVGLACPHTRPLATSCT